MVLRLCNQRAGGDGGHHLAQYPGTHGGHAVKQLAAGLLRINGDLFTAEHIAGIQPLVHLHDGNAGLGVAVQHGPLHRSAAAILGQQGDVQVDAAIFRRFQHRLRQDAAISHHHDQLRGQCADIFIFAAVPQGTGLEHRRAVGKRHFLHRRCGQHLLAANRLIPPGIHCTDVMPGSIQGFQALGGNIRRAHEQNAHQLFPFASRAAFLPSSVSS